MPGTILCALLIVFASVVVGRALTALLGWSRPEWVAGAVGLAALVVVAPFAVRLPGRGLTSAILLAIVVIACAVLTRRSVPDTSTADLRQETRGAHLVALAVVAVVLAAACLPFLFNERTGVLGEGIYTNDQAAQLYWADWLAEGFGPQPNAVRFGYPVGPQALAATVSEGTGVNLIDAFNGLLLAIPALTALAALSVLTALPPWRRGLAASLTGLPYLGASFLAQSGFKETTMAMLVVALGVVLHMASRPESRRERRESTQSAHAPPSRLSGAPPARAVVGVIAVLGAAAVFTFSIPGGVWFAVAIPVWALLMWGFSAGRVDMAKARADLAAHRKLLVGGAIALVALAVLALGPASAFVDKIDAVQESSGRLSSPVFPGEALGIWPEGDYRMVRGEVSGSLLVSGFAGLCALAASLALVRRREWALLATLVAAAFVYALTRPFAEIHVEAKALAVLAPIAMLVTVRWLLAPARHGAETVRLGVGALFAALALASTFLALREAPVGFDERGREDLRALAEEADGEPLVFLGVDRFAAYYLRGTLIESPGGYVPPDVEARPEKTWQQGLAMDFDTLNPSKLDRYRYAITTGAAYASTPPENFSEVKRAGDYVLWERSGETPRRRVLDEGGEPGAVFDCATLEQASNQSTVLEEPAAVDQDEWEPGFYLEAPGAATVAVTTPPGEWSLSLQYHSQVPLTVLVGGEEVAELPPSLEGFYLTGAGRGAFWPAGEIETDDDGVEFEVEVEAAEPSGFQEALGVERKVWLGALALSSQTPPQSRPLSGSCGDYVDHYDARESG